MNTVVDTSVYVILDVHNPVIMNNNGSYTKSPEKLSGFVYNHRLLFIIVI
jgi:hypothetical protein